ncbi:hypothetical protein G6011_06050 [Alternaria panax]|uniref:Uncharacterized protein n=1 Tax=Alternaria panax TaxID=48097 RepID=A0AAD4FG32_9PLEO|nr:hypothetical protein G6011_06050 [Alternaria panax]
MAESASIDLDKRQETGNLAAAQHLIIGTAKDISPIRGRGLDRVIWIVVHKRADQIMPVILILDLALILVHEVEAGERKIPALILTEKLQNKIQWKEKVFEEQAESNSTMESIKHRWEVKCSGVIPDKEPTDWQKKTLEKLVQDIELLKLVRNFLDGKIADEVSSKDKVNDKRAHSGENGVEDTPILLSEPDRMAQGRAERLQNDISERQNSVERSPQGSMADAQSPENRQLKNRVRIHDSRPARGWHQSEEDDDLLDHLRGLVADVNYESNVRQPSAFREHRTDYKSREIH